MIIAANLLGVTLGRGASAPRMSRTPAPLRASVA